MQVFRFRLESVRKWRSLELEREREKLECLLIERKALEARRDTLDRERDDAERSVLNGSRIDPQELAALDAHRRWVASEKQRLSLQERDCDSRIGAQREAVRKADQRLRLLEKLKQRKREEWDREADREVENLAAELYLARRGRA